MGNSMTIRWLRGLALACAAMMAAAVCASAARADEAVMPGIRVEDENTKCTAGFAAQGNDGSYYLMTSGHCDKHDGSPWTYGDVVPLGKISASEEEGDKRDAAIILLDPGVGAPLGHIGGRYSVRDVLSLSQVEVGMPFCKVGAITGETCGVVKSTADGVVEASVFSLTGDSGSPGFVKNPDGTVSAVGLLMSSPDGDDYTTYFVPVDPLLGKWGLHILQ
jgi:hypothetical protein